MSDPQTTLTISSVRSRLPQLYEQLSRADSDRLEKILPLFRLGNRTKANLAELANLAECLDQVSPGKERSKQQADFRQFRQHVKTSFEKAGLQDRADRRYTQTHRGGAAGMLVHRSSQIDETAAHIENFSKMAADDDQPDAIEPMGVEPKFIGKTLVKCCIVSADTDKSLAAKLTKSLREQFDAADDFIYQVWEPADVLAGETLD